MQKQTALHARGTVDEHDRRRQSTLPTWPLTAALAGFPLWWLLGVVEFIWIPAGGIMLLFMIRRGSIRVPRGFGIWMLFVVWAACSIIGLAEAMQFIKFGYRLSSFLACGLVFVYVFNARASLTDRFLTGLLTVWWGIIVAGGYIAMMLPNGVIRTPASYLIPGSLLSNEWVNKMVIRPLNQYNPESYFQLDPRPAAPFIYTNQWGNAYSLLLPFVIAYLVQIYGTRRFWAVAAAIPVSFVPAIMTTNRGMLIGVVVAAVYVAARLAVRGDLRATLTLASAAAVGFVVFRLLPVAERIETRSEATSVEDRGSLYLQSLDAVRESPLFGYGRTFMAEGGVDPVGTQGEFWTVLVSHGLGGVALFLAWFIYAFVRSFRWRSMVVLAMNAVLLVAILEFFFYGTVPHTLPVIMIAAAMTMRGQDDPPLSSPDPRIRRSTGNFKEQVS